MKQTKTFIVVRDKESGHFLTNYKNNENVLALTAGYKKEIQSALFIPEENFEKDKKRYDGLLQALEAEPLIVEAEYTLTTLDGEEPGEIKVDNQSKAKMLFDALDDIFGGDD
ncbi:hypothetical protein KJR08_00800 [Streptococcus lutetiensis]|uniref:hypothetical protein n=1 Tax=Streptococcus lutetiensis TaxID=150055 RepID=UPI001BDA33A1|nr:hypothetical protein [Streptococcus lutetiensis]MBT0946925.1 hypothetical protein [Streptococcus lutetiensis]